MAASLRQMRKELEHTHIGPLALHTLNQRLHLLATLDPNRTAEEFRQIWEAPRYETMLRRYLQVVRTYRHTQPDAVATLRRDFRMTVTYYALEKEFPPWERRHLRTTSRLERFNRRLRRRTRTANAYHSNLGLTAMIAQEVRTFHDAQQLP